MWVFNAAMAGYFVVNGEPGVSEPARAAAAASRPRRRDPLSALSAREREVLALTAEGTPPAWWTTARASRAALAILAECCAHWPGRGP